MNLAVFASGNGSNFEAIVKKIKKGEIKINSVVLVCDQPGAFVIKRALKHNIRVILVSRRDFKNRDDFETAITERLKNYRINLIALAGFMRVLSPAFVKKFKDRIINIHPSLLPAFKGACAIKDAYDSRCSSTGVTVHFVDKEVDHGPVILQKEVKIDRADSLASLEKKIHLLEHKLYPQALKLFIERKIRFKKGRVCFINF